VTSDAHTNFLARARHEAERYGADTWVFVRELLQNARDAGAHRVWFEIDETRGRQRISCRDDGEGMTFDHARRYLFTLYASSKTTESQAAGRFGIGFWSILRFAPGDIMVRSSATGGRGWLVRLDGHLEIVGRETVAMERGTEVVIERKGCGERVERAVRAAILRDAPFLRRRGRGGEPLEVRVNGTTVRAEPKLPAPSLRFRRRGLRGAVGLGPVPRVEVFAHGLRVRDAASLDELLLTGRRGRPGVSGVAGGLAPVALMDSSELTVLMARGDAREDRQLRQLVAVGHHELRRLVRRELDRHSRSSFVSRAAERVREAWTASTALRVLTVIALAWLAGFALWRLTMGDGQAARESHPASGTGAASRPALDSARPYFDLGARYGGPRADSLTTPSAAIALEYRPADRQVLFAGLAMTGIGADGRPLFPPPTDDPLIEASASGGDGIEIALRVAAGTDSVRLPTPPGYVPDPPSLRFNGEPVPVSGTDRGLAVVALESGAGGVLWFRCVPGRVRGQEGPARWPPLPREAAIRAREIAGLPNDLRASRVVDYVRGRVVYDASSVTADEHRREQARGLGLFERSLKIGAGDCDVQNALVAAMLETAGVRARLAVGWVGRSGGIVPGLHAWTEYEGTDGRWRVVDASGGSRPSRRTTGVLDDSSGRVAGDSRRLVVVAAGLASLLGIAALLLARNRSERTFTGGGRESIAGLVRAAATRPEAFADIHPVFTRHLLPTIGGRKISLARAGSMSLKGCLAIGSQANDLAEKAARRGIVLDAASLEAVAAAEALGALDLDEWRDMINRSWIEPVAKRVAEALVESGEPCHVRLARSVGQEVAVLDGSKVGLDRSERWVIVDYSSTVWRTARDLCEERPAVSALLLADAVVDRLGLPRELRDRHLAGLARAALDEQSGMLQ
jgi:transglutaminase-like putative cysteine protease